MLNGIVLFRFYRGEKATRRDRPWINDYVLNTPQKLIELSSCVKIKIQLRNFELTETIIWEKQLEDRKKVLGT